MPKPVLTPLSLSFPLASSDLGSEVHENEFMMNNLHLFLVCFSHTLFKFDDHHSLLASLSSVLIHFYFTCTLSLSCLYQFYLIPECVNMLHPGSEKNGRNGISRSGHYFT